MGGRGAAWFGRNPLRARGVENKVRAPCGNGPPLRSRGPGPGLPLLIPRPAPQPLPRPSPGPQGCLPVLLVPGRLGAPGPPACLPAPAPRRPGASPPTPRGPRVPASPGAAAFPPPASRPPVCLCWLRLCPSLCSFVSELHPCLKPPPLPGPDPSSPGAPLPASPPAPTLSRPALDTDRSLWGVKLQISSGKILDFACVLSPLG